MLKNLIFKGVKVLTRISVKLIKYTLKQLRYLIVGFIFSTALLLDINYNFIKKYLLLKVNVCKNLLFM